MLPMRVAAKGPTAAVSVPSIPVLIFPNKPITPTANCPPNTGVAKV
jgi:hypothetical protein